VSNNLNLIVYTRCCITRILYVFLCAKRCIVNYMSYELLWIIEKWNNRSLSIHWSIVLRPIEYFNPGDIRAKN